MNDTRSGLPESNTVLGSASSKEIVNLLVDILSTSQILDTSSLRLNQVIAVNGSGDGNGGETSRHELKESHLSGSILASNSLFSIRKEKERRKIT